jgi:hypothetical protein
VVVWPGKTDIAWPKKVIGEGLSSGAGAENSAMFGSFAHHKIARKISGSMSARFTLLFVSDNPGAWSPFHDFLQDAGFRVLTAHNTGSAVLRSYNEPVDGVLIYQDDVRRGNFIGCNLKSLYPNTPLVVISTGLGMMAPSLGIDAICYTNSLDYETSQVIAMLLLDVLSAPSGIASTAGTISPVGDGPGYCPTNAAIVNVS